MAVQEEIDSIQTKISMTKKEFEDLLVNIDKFTNSKELLGKEMCKNKLEIMLYGKVGTADRRSEILKMYPLETINLEHDKNNIDGTNRSHHGK